MGVFGSLASFQKEEEYYKEWEEEKKKIILIFCLKKKRENKWCEFFLKIHNYFDSQTQIISSQNTLKPYTIFTLLHIGFDSQLIKTKI